jgi:hypothetical protein
VKRPKFTDGKGRYRNAAETAQPGYLARRFEAIRRLQRMKARKSTVTTFRKVSHG